MAICAIIGGECPRTNDPKAERFCPAWSDGIVWTNVQTGAEKVANCSFAMLMPTMVEVVKASNRPAAAIESTRNEIATGFEQLRAGVSRMIGARTGG